jgi:3-oxoacyl-[acyl-carrier protein] reductase
VVINAGIGEGQSVEESDPELWRRTIEVNLLGAYYCAQAAIPALRKRGAGKIITLGSGLGHRGAAGMSAYACSKAGLWMLTRVRSRRRCSGRWAYEARCVLIAGPGTRTTSDQRE